MRRPDRSSSQQPYGSGDEELVICKPVRKESLPRTPFQGSGEQLVDCVLMSGFGQTLAEWCAAPSHLSLQVKGHRLSFVRDSERRYQGSAALHPAHYNAL